MPAMYINPAVDETVLSIGDVQATTGGFTVDTDGEYEYTTVKGTSITRTLKAGYHPIQIKSLEAAAGTVTGLYAT